MKWTKGCNELKGRNRLRLRAYAKINLSLDVIGRRADGYHDVEMVMQSIDLWDGIELGKIEKGIELICRGMNLPDDRENIAYRAATLIKDEYNIKEGIRIKIDKRIPLGAGLGGGSADCAGVLVGLNKLWNLGLKSQDLREIGMALGADVPFCIEGGTAIARGIGEKLTPIVFKDSIWLVLVNPGIHVSTQSIYKGLKFENIIKRPHTQTLINALTSSNKEEISKNLINVLETSTIPIYPEINEIKAELLKQGALGSSMTGSGPTVFGIFDDAISAKRCEDALKGKYKWVRALETVQNGIKGLIHIL